jgi:DNA-binding transcriptional ArsR family regulator
MREFVRIFKALSDPTRLRAFLLLMERDLCICELTFVLEMSQSRVSHQLKPLRDADLVETSREGRWIIYSIPGPVKKVLAPLLRDFSGKYMAGSRAAVHDRERLGLCLRKRIGKTCGKEAA